ncbi:PLP-dependent aminotransferase family protein [Rhizobium grahamii]|uniref:GntR family transcriptional regulator n=1 Tax=Rhizobium grahamii CCGE 502 TaxID=990285 RepID=S3I3S3_9HYPH|nr:PLP-dependent aminotransferase family protein [Rhizobium grahamii]EPE94283.1 GntR family transcriptional regulator [Rhizobium grahamii CCGE 502]
MAATSWTPQLGTRDGPIYLSIADSLAHDIASGRLAEGARLPTQRKLADDLGIDFTTVSRAYSEARSRGLIEGKVGQGTYVRAKRGARLPQQPAGLVDMSMNLPPRFLDPVLEQRMWDGAKQLQEQGLDLLLRYQEPGGIMKDRIVAASWLSRRLPGISPDRVVVTSGAQGALHAILSVLTNAGDVVCAEELTYPGFRSIASHLRLKLAPVPMDDQGLIPDAFAHVCREAKPKALYCMPTLHNPTTRTLPVQRRHDLVNVARTYGVPIIEDDAYSALVSAPPPPLAALLPEAAYHVASLSKCLSPALRVAYVALPEGRTHRLANAIRASASIVSPLSSALASQWIETGVADFVRGEIVKETARRLDALKAILPFDVESSPGGFHVWLKVPEPWTRGELVSSLRSIGVVTSDAFAIDSAPEAIRLALGAPVNLEELTRALRILADLLAQQPAISTMVV